MKQTAPKQPTDRILGPALVLSLIALCLSAILLGLIGYTLRETGPTPAPADRPSATPSLPPSPPPPVGKTATEAAPPPMQPSPAPDTPSPTPTATVTPNPSPTPSPAVTVSTPWPAALETAIAWQSARPPSDAELKTIVAEMPLRDKIGQMLMVGFHGRTLADSPELPTLIGDYHIGGVVMLESNAHDPQQIGRLTTDLQSLAASVGQGIPLFIAINQEGGIVVRITEGATGFPGNMAVAAAHRPDYAYLAAALTAYELRSMGINMNLAPVLDVNDNPLNPVIGVRSFGDSAALTAEYGRLAVRGSRDAGGIAVAKHFPGHGSVAADSHSALPVLDASPEELAERELRPFAAAVEEGVPVIMTAHIAVPSLDSSGRPATLSAPILTGLLRQQMGFEGVIMTDSLGMSGVRAGRGQVQAALEAVQAGADILLTTSPMKTHIAILKALEQAVQQGEIPVERIDESVVRILRLKYTYGLFQVPPPLDLTAVGAAEHQAIADEIARRAVTVLRDDEGNLPLPPPPARLLLISPQELPKAANGTGTLLAAELRRRGYTVTEITMNPYAPADRERVYAQAIGQAAAHDVVIFGEWALIKLYVKQGDTWQEDLIARLQQAAPRLVVIAWHNPAAILRCPTAPTFLTAYGNTPGQVTAVVAVLVGEQEAKGQLPIHLAP